jgi:sugar lactone lactonase YvrE
MYMSVSVSDCPPELENQNNYLIDLKSIHNIKVFIFPKYKDRIIMKKNNFLKFTIMFVAFAVFMTAEVFASISVEIQPSTTQNRTNPVSIPLTMNNLTHIEIQSIELNISYDPAVLTATGISLTGTVLENENYIYDYNTHIPGIIYTGFMSNASHFTGTGLCLYADFTVIGASGETSDITISTAIINNQAVSTSDGIFTVAPDTPPIFTGMTPHTINEDALLSTSLTINDYESNPCDLTLTIISSDETLVLANTISYTCQSGNYYFAITPVADQYGLATITIVAEDSGGLTASASFDLTVVSVNDAPVISASSSLTMNEDTSIAFSLTATDIETAGCSLGLTWQSSDSSILSGDNISYTCTGDVFQFSLTPVENQFGNLTVSFTITDAGSFTSTHALDITVVEINDTPQIAAIGNQTQNEIAPIESLELTATDIETATCSMGITIMSSNTILLPISNIAYTCISNSFYFTLTPVSGQNGTSTISVVVTDSGGLTASTSFDFIINLPPELSIISDMKTAAGDISFTFVEAEGDSVALTITSSDQSLINDANIQIVGGTGNTILLPTTAYVEQNVSIQLNQESNAHGLATITVEASATGGTVIETFNVIVSPPGAGNALSFDGINDYVNLGNSTALKPANALTYEMWVYHSNWPACDSNIISNTQAGGYAFVATPDYFKVETSVNGSYQYANFNKTLTGSGWHHFALTFDGRYLKSFLDGEQKAESDLGASYTLTYHASNSTIIGGEAGTGSAPTGRYFDGKIDELRIWNTARTASQIRSTMCQRLTGGETGLVAYYRFDHSSGTTLIDLTGNGLNGILNNMIDSDWTISETALGDDSVYDYTGSVASDFSVTLSHSDGDAFTALGDSGSYSGLHVYLVNESPSSYTAPAGFSGLYTDHYYGVFPIGITPTYSIAYNYSGNTSIASENGLRLASRSNQAGSWADSMADVYTSTTTISKTGISAFIGISETEFIPGQNIPPAFGSVSDQTISEDSALSSIPIVVTDSETATCSLGITFNSSLPALLSVADISYTCNADTIYISLTPVANQSGTVDIAIIATDAAGLASSAAFVLTVTDINDAPVMSSISPQTTDEDMAIDSIAFTATDLETAACGLNITFISSDPTLISDTNLSYSCDADQYTITAIPQTNQNGVATITVIVADSGDLTTSTSFDLTVSSVNDAPYVANPIADRIATEGNAYAYTIPSNTFTDVDPGDILTYTATQSDGSALPGWLSFDPATGEFTGLPTNSDVGSITITVTATDNSTEAITDTFVLSVNNTNSSPVLDYPIADQTATQDVAYSFTFAANTFSDDDVAYGDTISYTAMQADGSPLPFWLTFDIYNRNFSGIPTNYDVGMYTITVIAEDTLNLTAMDRFYLTVVNINDAPEISDIYRSSAVISGLTIDEDSLVDDLSFSIYDMDVDDTSLTVSLESSNTSLVPVSNMSYSCTYGNCIMSLTPVANENGTAIITVIVTDPQGLTASNAFDLTVTAVNDTPVISSISNQSIIEDHVLDSVSFTASDIETSDCNFTLSVNSSYTQLIPIESITYTCSSGTYHLSITPAEDQSGSTTITIAVSDSGNLSVSESFDITVIPAGPGNVDLADGSGDLKVWFKADTLSSLNDGDSVATWSDSSGNNNDAAQINASYRPVYRSAAFNNQPAVEFDGVSLHCLTGTASQDFSAPATIIFVAKDMGSTDLVAGVFSSGSGGIGIFSNAGLEYVLDGNGAGRDTSSNTQMPINTSRIITGYYSQNSTSGSKIYLSGLYEENYTGSGYSTPGSTSFEIGGRTPSVPSRIFKGQIAEIAVYSRELTPVAQTHIELYLMDKYDIDLVGSALDADLLKNARGISKQAEVTISGSSAGLTIADAGFLQDNDDIVIIGHNELLNQEISDDLPTGPTLRWSRTWKVTVNDSNSDGGAIQMIFGFNSAGMQTSPSSADAYSLLYRSGVSGNFAIVSTTSTSINDDAVIFNVPNIQNGYYTIGSTDSRTQNEAPVAGFAQALQLDGTDDYVVIPHSDILKPSTITVEAWIRADSWATNMHENVIVGSGDNEIGAEGYTLRCGANGTLDFALGSNSSWQNASSPALMQAGVWTHVAGTFDGTTIKTYINGVLEGSLDISGSAINYLTKTPLQIGEEPGYPGRFFHGLIDEVRVWNYARTSQELQSTMNEILNGDETGLVGYWRFDQTFSNQFKDHSGNNNSGILMNMDSNQMFALSDFNSSFIIDEDTVLTLTAGYDLDGDTYTLTTIVGPSNGVIALDAAMNILSYTPDTGYSGADMFVYGLHDGLESNSYTISVDVTSTNDLPVISSIADQTTKEDGSIDVYFTASDVETSACGMAITLSSSDQAIIADGNLTYVCDSDNYTITATPLSDQNGTVSISVSVGDSNGATATTTFDLTVTAVNDAPTLNLDGVLDTFDEDTVLSNAISLSDVDGDSLTLSVISSSDPGLIPVENITFSGTGLSRTITITPTSNASGNVTVTIAISDGNLTSTTELALTVTTINDYPSIGVISDQTTIEDIATNVISFTATDIETSTCNMTLSIRSSDQILVPDEYLLSMCSGNEYSIVATPAMDQYGMATISVTITDAGGATASTSFNLTVTDVDDSQYKWANFQAAESVLGQTDFISGTGGTTDSLLNHPSNVAVDPTTGKVFVCDGLNHRILRFSATESLLNGSSAEAVLGQVNYTSGSENRGTGVNVNTFNNPTSAWVDTFGRLWVADQANHRVLRFDNASSKTDGADADAVLGQTDFTTATAGTTQNQLKGPGSVWVDASGTLWVSDSSNNRVLRFDTPELKANGANADAVLGQTNFTTATAGLTQSKFNTPLIVRGDNNGSLFVSDVTNNRVLRFDNAALKSNGDNADAVLGQSSFTTNTARTTDDGLSNPRSVAVDHAGHLYVAENNNRRISIYKNAANKADGASADYVLGQPDFTSNTQNNGGISEKSLKNVHYIFFDNQANHLWVPDYSNYRVLRFSMMTKIPPEMSLISDTTIDEDTVSNNLSFTVTDINEQELTIIYNSSNTSLISASSISFTGNQVSTDGATYTVTTTAAATIVTLNICPEIDQSGTASITITVTDPDGMVDSQSFILTITNINDAPYVANPIADRIAIEGNAYAYTIPSNTFTDVDFGDILTYTATQFDGSALPGWLSFDPATLEFTGLPTHSDVGSITITVTATDSSSESITDTFVLNVNNTNSSPVLDYPIADQTATQDVVYSFTFAANTFSDDDVAYGDTISYTAMQADGSQLPFWLTFDIYNRKFSGTPTNYDVGMYTITVIAEDTLNLAAMDTFYLTVDNVNDAPVLDIFIPDQTTTEDTPYSFSLANNTFSDADLSYGDTLSYTATLSDGNPLPSWLTFDNTSQTFSGTPLNEDVGMITITVTVEDTSNETASGSFNLTVTGVNDAPVIADTAETAKNALSFTFTTAQDCSVSLTITSSDQSIVADASIIIAESGTNSNEYASSAAAEQTVYVNYTPVVNVHGRVTFTVDASAFGNTSSRYFSVIVSPPGAGNALDFDDSDDYVEIPYNADLNPAIFTVSLWTKIEGGLNTNRSPLTSRGSSLSGYFIYAGSSNKWEFIVGNGTWQWMFGEDVVLNQWTHLAMTYDGTQMKAYINGILQNSLTTSFSQNTTSPLRIGAGQTESTPSFIFNGKVDEVRIYNIALSTEEVRDVMCQRLNGNETGLVAYYRFDNVSGTALPDLSGNGYDGTLMNMDNSNWQTSGAALGDISVHDYSGTIESDFSVSTAHSDGDRFTATGDGGSFSGIHVYLVSESPNTTAIPDGYTSIDTDHYYGVFPVGTSPTYKIAYNYSGNTYASDDNNLQIACRNNHADTWTGVVSTQYTQTTTLVKTGISAFTGVSATEFILGKKEVTEEIHAPTISDVSGQTMNEDSYLTVSYLINDSDNSNISISAVSSDTSIVSSDDITWDYIQEGTQKFIVKTGETIVAGDVVAYINGNIQKGGAGLISDFSTTSPNTMTEDSVEFNSAARLDDSRFIVAYKTTNIKVKIGTLDGTSIIWGDEYTFSTSTDQWSTVGVLDSSKVVIVYKKQGTLKSLTAIIGEISGNSISFGTPKEMNPDYNTSEYISLAVLNDSAFAIAYRNDNVDSLIHVVIGNVTGTTISNGDHYTIDNIMASSNSIAALNESKFVLAYSYHSEEVGSDNSYCVVGEVSGTSISWGNTYSYNTQRTQHLSLAVMNENQFILAYQDLGNAAKGTALIGEVNGTAITYATPQVFNNATTEFISMSKMNDTSIVIAFNTSNKGKAIVGDVDGTTLSWSGIDEFWSSTYIEYVSCEMVNDTQFVVLYKKGSGGNGLATIGSFSSIYPIGVASSDGIAGEQVTVVNSGVVEGLSGLTENDLYYADDNGNLTTSVTSHFIGTGLSSNALIIQSDIPGGASLFNTSNSCTITLTPTKDQWGLLTITVQVTNSHGLTAVDSFGLTVLSVNDPPVIGSIADQTTLEDITTDIIRFAVTDDETPACSMTLTMSSSDQTLIPDDYLLSICKAGQYSIVATPAQDQYGTATISVTITDAQGLAENTSFALAVADVDDSSYFWVNNQAADIVLGQPDFTSIDSGTTNSTFANPPGVAVDPTTGKVFVSDRNNHRVLRFSSVAAAVNGSSAEAVFGQADFTSGQANRGGNVAANTINHPDSLYVDSFGRLWLPDRNNHRILRFDDASVKDSGANADAVLGQPDFTSYTAGTNQNTLNSPTAVWIDHAGRLWGTDMLNHRVLRFDDAINKPNGANADAVLGQSNFTSYSTGTTQSAFNHPHGIIGDNSGNIYIVDYTNNRVLCFENAAQKANGANADKVIGQSDFTADITGVTNQNINNSVSVSLDNTGKLYVADSYNNRILIFNNIRNKSNGAPADYVLGQPNFTSNTANNGGISERTLNLPLWIFMDNKNNHLWTPDFNNNRVLRYRMQQQKEPPIMSAISDLTMDEDTISSAISFTVTDNNEQALTITYTSSNTSLISSSSILFSGTQVSTDGNDYLVSASVVTTTVTLTISPEVNQSGTSFISVTVTDPNGMTAVQSFSLTVTAVNDAPEVSTIHPQSINEGTSIALNLTVTDAENSSLSVTAISNDQSLIQDSDIVLSNDGSTYTLTIMPMTNQAGSTDITISVDDGTDMTHMTFSITVNEIHYMIAGHVSVYTDIAGSDLEGVILTLSGTHSYSMVTDATGCYTFSTVRPGDYTLTASKSDDINLEIANAVNILKAVVRKISLSCLGQIAADANIDGYIGAYDASKVLDYLAGFDNCLNTLRLYSDLCFISCGAFE